jgi:hypothetical protein
MIRALTIAELYYLAQPAITTRLARIQTEEPSGSIMISGIPSRMGFQPEDFGLFLINNGETYVKLKL